MAPNLLQQALLERIKLWPPKENNMSDDVMPTPTKPVKVKGETSRKRRNSSNARVALALVETHLRGVYSQMESLLPATPMLPPALNVHPGLMELLLRWMPIPGKLAVRLVTSGVLSNQ